MKVTPAPILLLSLGFVLLMVLLRTWFILAARERRFAVGLSGVFFLSGTCGLLLGFGWINSLWILMSWGLGWYIWFQALGLAGVSKHSSKFHVVRSYIFSSLLFSVFCLPVFCGSITDSYSVSGSGLLVMNVLRPADFVSLAQKGGVFVVPGYIFAIMLALNWSTLGDLFFDFVLSLFLDASIFGIMFTFLYRAIGGDKQPATVTAPTYKIFGGLRNLLRLVSRVGTVSLTVAVFVTPVAYWVENDLILKRMPYYYFCHYESASPLLRYLLQLSNEDRRLTKINIDQPQPPLEAALDRGNIAATKILLEAGADYQACWNENLTAVHLSALSGDEETATELINLLVGYGANINIARKLDDRTPLHLAASAGRTRVCSHLIKLDAELTVQDDLGQTPLHLAVLERQWETALALVHHGADISQKDFADRTPIDYAEEAPGQVQKALRMGVD